MPRHPMRQHSTLVSSDLDGAVEISTRHVLGSLDDGSTSHIFGSLGSLPPEAVQRTERHFTEMWQIEDPQIKGRDWVGLNSVTNDSKGSFMLTLQPGEYKFSCNLPKDLNANILVNDVLGGVVGGAQGLFKGGEAGEIARKRRVPTLYCDIRIVVQSSTDGKICNASGILDQGTKSSYTKLFTVTEAQAPVSFNLYFRSHSIVKRLKVKGSLYRRDLVSRHSMNESMRQARATIAASEKRRRAATTGAVPLAVQTKYPFTSSPDEVRRVLTNFYEAHAPNKLVDLEVVMRHFAGRYDDCFHTLEMKYHVSFDEAGVAMPHAGANQ